jgi:hypothetical protein
VVVMVTFAPGIKAPVGSVMWPRSVPVEVVEAGAGVFMVCGGAGSAAWPFATRAMPIPSARRIKAGKNEVRKIADRSMLCVFEYTLPSLVFV